MRSIGIIAAREFRRYFVSPIAYAGAAIIFLVLGSIFVMNIGFGLPTGTLLPDGRMVLQPLVIILMLVTPAFTMRLLAGEQRAGTLELLLAAPVRDWEVVIGKWLGSFGFLLVILAGTWVYPIIINRLTVPGIDQGALLSAYFGLIALVAALLAIGLFASSLFSNQPAAYLTAVGIILALWVLGGVRAGSGTFSQAAAYLGILNHYYDNLYQGVIHLTDLIFYVSLTALALFLTSLIVESRRWR